MRSLGTVRRRRSEDDPDALRGGVLRRWVAWPLSRRRLGKIGRVGGILILAVVSLGWISRARGAASGTQFDGERALADVQTQLSIGPRPAGSGGRDETGDWIEGQLAAFGWTVTRDEFSKYGLTYRNIVARSGPSGDAPILLGAHYDTRPLADRDVLSPGEPVPGANDGASGVAVLLELARVLPKEAPGREIWIVFFDGEDGGGMDGRPWIVGSTAFAETLEVSPLAVVIVDMVGDTDLQLPMEANSDPALAAEIWDVAKDLGSPAFQDDVRHRMTDDHLPFVGRGIPAVDIIDFDYPYWHTTQDTIDKVSAQSLEQVGRVLETWIVGLD
jgi:glutaminyl-peptide cyclotransferase